MRCPKEPPAQNRRGEWGTGREKRAPESVSVIKYVRAFLISSLRAQLVNHFTGPLVQLVEVLSLVDAHASSRITSDTVKAGV